MRERSRRYYRQNRERVLSRRAAAKAARPPAEPKPPTPNTGTCSECGGPLKGRQAVVCSRKCKDARYRRLHPDEYRAKERRKAERRRKGYGS